METVNVNNENHKNHEELNAALDAYVDSKVRMDCAQDRVAILLQTVFNCNTEQSFMLAEGMCEAAYRAAVDE